jgi:hypothetical protein
MNEVQLSQENELIPKKISEIEAIRETRNATLRSRDEIKEYVESPLVLACKHQNTLQFC